MFCSTCGANIGNANFCPICGNKTNKDYVIAQDCNLDISSHDNGVQQVNNLIITENCSVGQTSKEKALEEVDKLFDYFNQKADLYKEYDSLIKSYQKLSNGKDLKLGIIVFSIILGIPALLSLLMGSPIGLLFLLPILFLCLLKYDEGKKYKINSERIKERFKEVKLELVNNYNNYANCPIGFEYSNPEVIAIIKKTLISGRAESLKEAINIILDDIHKRNLENGIKNIEQLSGMTAIYTAANFLKN